MLIVHVSVHVKAGMEEAFEAATQVNARASLKEPGVARFDMLRERADGSRYLLVEVYRTPDDPARHKATPHYAVWRDAVEPMMAEPRRSVQYEDCFWSDPG